MHQEQGARGVGMTQEGSSMAAAPRLELKCDSEDIEMTGALAKSG